MTCPGRRGGGPGSAGSARAGGAAVPGSAVQASNAATTPTTLRDMALSPREVVLFVGCGRARRACRSASADAEQSGELVEPGECGLLVADAEPQGRQPDLVGTVVQASLVLAVRG